MPATGCLQPQETLASCRSIGELHTIRSTWIAPVRIDGLEHHLGILGPNAGAGAVLVDDVEVGQHQQLLAWLEPEIGGAHEKAGADAGSPSRWRIAATDKRPVEPGLPPSVRLRPPPCPAPPRAGPGPAPAGRAAAAASSGADLEAAARQLQQPRAEHVDQPAGPRSSVASRSQTSVNWRSVLAIWNALAFASRRIGLDVALDGVPVVEAQRRLGQGRQDTTRCAAPAASPRAVTHDLAATSLRLQVGRDAQPEPARAGQQRQQVDAVPGVRRGFSLVWPAVGGDRLLQRVARARAGLVAGIEEDLLVGAAEQTRGLGELGMVLRQTRRATGCSMSTAAVALPVSIRYCAYRRRFLGSFGSRRLTASASWPMRLVLARVAQLLHQPLRLAQILDRSQPGEAVAGLTRRLAQLVGRHQRSSFAT